MNKISTRRVSAAFMIGLFSILSLFALVGSVIWLGANKFFKENEYYATYFEGSVEGLETGSPVKYQGVPVGSISKIEVAPDGKLIQIIMQIDSKIAIPDSIRIKSEFAGIAGGKFLQLHYPDDKSFYSMHPKLNFQSPYRVINSAPSGFDEIQIAAKDIMNNLNRFNAGEVSEGAVNFFKGYTEFVQNKELYEMISSLNSASGSLASVMAKADSSGAIANVTAATGKLVETAQRMKDFTDLINKKVDDIEINSRLDRVEAGYTSLIKDLQATIGKLGNQSTSVMLTLNEALEQFKSTNRELKKSLRAISDHPTQIFLSEPPPKEK
jgi:ABC-type transporter Mla subunit MlaD